MNLPPGLQWSPSEAAALNEFLSSPVGRKWITILMTRKPRLDLGTTERAALTGAFASGYEHFFNEIAGMRIALPSEEPGNIRAIDPSKD
jgi:hypothetical protein